MSEELKDAAGRFKKSTSTVDGVPPGMMQHLDDKSSEVLSTFSDFSTKAGMAQC